MVQYITLIFFHVLEGVDQFKSVKSSNDLVKTSDPSSQPLSPVQTMSEVFLFFYFKASLNKTIQETIWIWFNIKPNMI